MTAVPLSEGVSAINALRAAQVWLKVLVAEMDIEPETTTILVKMVGPGRAEIIDRRTLAQSMAQIDEAIREAGYDPHL